MCDDYDKCKAVYLGLSLGLGIPAIIISLISFIYNKYREG